MSFQGKTKVIFISVSIDGKMLGIMQLIAMIKDKCKYKVLLEKYDDVLLNIKEFKPDVVFYSTTTGLHKHYIKLNKIIKKTNKNILSVFGGPHPTFFPEMVSEDGVDAVCIGEGEYVISELIDRLNNNEDITSIKNLWVKKDNKIYRNEVRDLIENLDDLPFPERGFLKNYKKLKNLGFHSIMATRGCPFNCTYCLNYHYNKMYNGKGKIIRKRSVDSVINEIKEVKKKFPLNYVGFPEDIFVTDMEWINEFCEKYKKEINIPFKINMRANLINEEYVKKLKSAGIHRITIGIESGSDYIRNKVLKRNMSKEEIINACKIIKKYKIKLITENMICIPEETIDMAFETLDLNIKCKPDYAWISILQPYPKTKISEYKNYNVNKIGKHFYDDSVFNLKDKRKLINLHRFFSITIDYPILKKIIKIIIKLPNNVLFKYIFFAYKIYRYKVVHLIRS